MKFDKQAVWETTKFIVRMAILVGVPLVGGWLVNLPAPLSEIVAVVLPILDKWAHESKDIKANGLLPF